MSVSMRAITAEGKETGQGSTSFLSAAEGCPMAQMELSWVTQAWPSGRALGWHIRRWLRKGVRQYKLEEGKKGCVVTARSRFPGPDALQSPLLNFVSV